MNTTSHTVILMMSDPMFREGLRLLLSDMGFEVVSISSYMALEDILQANIVTPELLVLPQPLDINTSTIDLVRALREKFNRCIPTTIISAENYLFDSHMEDEDIVILPEQIKPKDLRLQICKTLGMQPCMSM